MTRLIFAGLLCGLSATIVSARATGCDQTVATAVVVPQTAIVSPFVVLPQFAVAPAVVQTFPTTSSVIVVQRAKRGRAVRPLRTRSVIRTRTIVR